MIKNISTICLLCGLMIAVGGCASAARDTTEFAMVDEATVNAPFDDAWQLTKAVLRERDIVTQTRDTRGFFVGFTDETRNLFLVPHRKKLTIHLEEVSASATKIRVETVDQVYGVTLLTYPDWHDRKTSDNAEAVEILAAIDAKAST